MKGQTKRVIIWVGVGLLAYVAYTIYQAIASGVNTLQGIISAPFTALANEAAAVTSSVSSTASAVTSAAASVPAGNAAAAKITSLNNSQYAPGGTIYNQIASQQGIAAANAAWATVQQNQATQASQTVTLDPLTWF